VLRDRWCDIVVLNMHALSDDSNDTVYEELEQSFYHSPKYYVKGLLGDFDKKLGREYIFKPTTGNGTLAKNTNDNGIGDANFVHKKVLLFRLITYGIYKWEMA